MSHQRLPTFVSHISSCRCARNFEIVKLNFFYLSVLQNYYAYTYSFFDNISYTFKQKKTSIHSLVCLLKSLLLTTCSLISFRLVQQFSNYRKNRCLSVSANSAGLHFRERVQKIKENGKKTKIENLKNGQEKYGWKKLAFMHICSKTSKMLQFLQILV